MHLGEAGVEDNFNVAEVEHVNELIRLHINNVCMLLADAIAAEAQAN